MNSIWSESIHLPQFGSLRGDRKTEVLSIGGGIAGILCAYFLQEQDMDYILAERESLCSQITKNTTAKITAQHGLIYDKILKSMGAERARMYLDANQKALEKYAELCQGIDCDFERKNSYVYSLDNPKKLEREAEALERIGCHPILDHTNELPFSTTGMVGFENQAQFHPLKFLAQIARELNIYEHSPVRELQEYRALLDQGSVSFQKLIIATHFPMDNRHGMYFLKLYQDRSHVVALENVPELKGMYVDEDKRGLSFRNYQDLLLLGGGSHKTGKKGGGWQELRDFSQKYYPDANEKYFWATQDCMSLDHIPYIGKYSKHRGDYFVAAGFNKWGMTSSMAAAMILKDLILEKENPYAEVFSPSRSMLKPQLLVNGGEAVMNLLTPTTKRCPHLGCALKWNPAEHSWDCPCHGSRFEADGRLLSNPANGDLRIGGGKKDE